MIDTRIDRFSVSKIVNLYESNRFDVLLEEFNQVVVKIGGYRSLKSCEKNIVLEQLPLKWDAMRWLGQTAEILDDMKDFMIANHLEINLLYDMVDVMEKRLITYLLDDIIAVCYFNIPDCNKRGVLSQKIRLADNNDDLSTKNQLTEKFYHLIPVPDYEKYISVRIIQADGDLILQNEHLVSATLQFLPLDSIQFFAKFCTSTHKVSLKLPFPLNHEKFLNGELRVVSKEHGINIYPISGRDVQEYLYSSPFGGAYFKDKLKILVDNVRAFEIMDKTQMRPYLREDSNIHILF